MDKTSIEKQMALVHEIAGLPDAGNESVRARRQAAMNHLSNLVLANSGACNEEVAVAAMFGARQEEDGCYSSRVPQAAMTAISLARSMSEMRGQPYGYEADFLPEASLFWLGRMPRQALWRMYGYDNPAGVRTYVLAMGIAVEGMLFKWGSPNNPTQRGKRIGGDHPRNVLLLNLVRNSAGVLPGVMTARQSLDEAGVLLGEDALRRAVTQQRPDDVASRAILESSMPKVQTPRLLRGLVRR